MDRPDRLMVCEHCDSVYRRTRLAPHETARCIRCGAVLERHGRLGIDGLLALTVATAVVFVIANAYPVIRIGIGGQSNEATLWQSVLALAEGYAMPLAAISLLAMFLVPLAQIVLLLWVLVPARRGRRAPGFGFALDLLGHLRPWSMIEVFLLGALVAIVKLGGLLEVEPAPGIYGIAALTVLLTLVAGRNLHALWDLTDPRAGAARPVAPPTSPDQEGAR